MSTTYVSGAGFFTRGFDTQIVKEDLLSQNERRQISALQQVVAYMTMGKDMSSVFNEVAALTCSNNVLLKRLTYLYIMQYSRAQPEKTVLQAGTFVKHTLHDSPLVRGAALRVMTSLPIAVMADFLTAPLRRCLDDADPYVRRIAVMGVLKQYSISATVSFESGLLDALPERLSDENHAVAAAAVVAITELVARGAQESLLQEVIKAEAHLVSLLPHGNEWSTLALADGIALAFETPPPRATEDAATAAAYVADRERTLQAVIPLLCHGNYAVVMAACKSVLHFLRHVSRPEPKRGAAVGRALVLPPEERRRLIDTYSAFAARTLISFIEAPRHEMRYVGLRSTLLLLHSDAHATTVAPCLRPFLSSFLIKYDDPCYIKLAKLDILVAIADDANGLRVLSELMVYATDSDHEIVRQSIRAVGTLAAALPSLASQCVQQLDILIHTRVAAIVEEAAVVVQLLLRRYPGQFLTVVPSLCDALTVVNSPEAQAAVAWVVGEYARCIPDALDGYRLFFTEAFGGLESDVQAAVLSAVVKMYTRGAPERAAGENLAAVEQVLALCTESAKPDLRDRAYFYWRLLVTDPDAARRVLAADQAPPLTDAGGARGADVGELERELGHPVARGLGTLVAVVHLPVAHIFGQTDDRADGKAIRNSSDDDEDEGEHNNDNNNEDDDDDDGDDGKRRRGKRRNGEGDGGSDDDGGFPTRDPGGAAPAGPEAISTPTARGVPDATTAAGEFDRVLDAAAGNGVEIYMKWSQLGAKLVLTCRFELLRGDDYVQHARVTTMQINANLFGLGITQVFPTLSLDPDDRPSEAALVVACNNKFRPTPTIEVAVEMTPVGVRYFAAPPIPPPLLLLPAVGCDPRTFAAQLQAMPEPAWVLPPLVAPARCLPHRLSTNALRMHSINLVHRKEAGELTGFFLHAETIARQRLLFELTLRGEVLVQLTVRCQAAPVAAFFGEYLVRYASDADGTAEDTGRASPLRP